MDYKYCKRCNKLYNYGTDRFCTDCLKAMDDTVLRIRDYLDENPGANVVSIRDELDIPEKDILFLIKEKRIEFTQIDTSSIRGNCAKCGKPVIAEKYCRECKEKMSQEMLNVTNKMREDIQNVADKNKGVMNALHDKLKNK